MSSQQTSRAPFIVLEGIDGSGTTTQVERLSTRLTESGLHVHNTREPTTGPIGRFLRTALQKKLTDELGQAITLDWAAMALLFAADRVDHAQREIIPELEKGRVVISDRYDLSSLLYQSLTSPQGESALGWLTHINAQVPRPDLTIVLDLSSDLAEKRRLARGGEAELYEVAELQRKLGAGYRKAGELLPADRCVVLDATGTVEEVEEKIFEIVRKNLTLPDPAGP